MFELFAVFLATLFVGTALESVAAGLGVFAIGIAIIITMRTRRHRQEMRDIAQKQKEEFEARMAVKKSEILRRAQASKSAKPFIQVAKDADNEDTQPFIRPATPKRRDQTIPFGIPQRKDSTIPYTTTRPVSDHDSLTDPLNPLSPLYLLNPSSPLSQSYEPTPSYDHDTKPHHSTSSHDSTPSYDHTPSHCDNSHSSSYDSGSPPSYDSGSNFESGGNCGGDF